MRREQNEVLKTNSQIKVTALIKTIFLFVIVDVAVAIFVYWFKCSSPNEMPFMWILYFCIIVITNIFLFYPIYSMAKNEEEGKKSKIFIEKYLPLEEWVEVLPIKADRYTNFIMNLTDTARFLAIRTEKNRWVIINIKFNHEKEGRFFQQIDPCNFTDYYKIKKNDEQEKEKQN